jgi:hypothetical protein
MDPNHCRADVADDGVQCPRPFVRQLPRFRSPIDRQREHTREEGPAKQRPWRGYSRPIISSEAVDARLWVIVPDEMQSFVNSRRFN